MLFEKNKLPTQRPKPNNDFVTDVIDGAIYQDFLNKENPDGQKDCYTFTLNTDGINLCEKSNLSIWPVYLVVNEIAIEERFMPDNIIIAGNIKQFTIKLKLILTKYLKNKEFVVGIQSLYLKIFFIL